MRRLQRKEVPDTDEAAASSSVILHPREPSSPDSSALAFDADTASQVSAPAAASGRVEAVTGDSGTDSEGRSDYGMDL